MTDRVPAVEVEGVSIESHSLAGPLDLPFLKFRSQYLAPFAYQ